MAGNKDFFTKLNETEVRCDIVSKVWAIPPKDTSKAKTQRFTRSNTQKPQEVVSDVEMMSPVKKSARVSKKVVMKDFVTTTSVRKRRSTSNANGKQYI